MKGQELLDTSHQALGVIAEAGFKQVELYFRKPDSAAFGRLGAAAMEEGVSIVSVHFSKPLLEKDPDSAWRTLREFIPLAAEQGAGMGVIHPPIKGGYRQGITDMAKVLQKIIPLAEKHGFILSLETVPIANAHLFLAEIIKKLPPETVQVTLDLKFQTSIGIPLEYFFEVLGERINNIHVNDFAGSLKDEEGRKKYPFLGEGIIDFSRVASVLKQYRYRGLLTLETSLQGFDNRLSPLRQAKELLNRLGEL